MLSKTILRAAAAAAFSVAAAASASADTVTFSGFTHGSEVVSYTITGPAPTSGSANAGGFTTTVLNGGPSFTSYCVDLYERITFGTPYPEYTDASATHFAATPAILANLSRLYTAAGALSTAVQEAAFQMAVWEIVYETTGTLSVNGAGSATFAGSMGATDLANGWLMALASISGGPSIGVLDSIGRPGHQDVIYAPVPEPSTIALMLAGLVGVGQLARRRSARRD